MVGWWLGHSVAAPDRPDATLGLMDAPREPAEFQRVHHPRPAPGSTGSRRIGVRREGRGDAPEAAHGRTGPASGEERGGEGAPQGPGETSEETPGAEAGLGREGSGRRSPHAEDGLVDGSPDGQARRERGPSDTAMTRPTTTLRTTEDPCRPESLDTVQKGRARWRPATDKDGRLCSLTPNQG